MFIPCTDYPTKRRLRYYGINAPKRREYLAFADKLRRGFWSKEADDAVFWINYCLYGPRDWHL